MVVTALTRSRKCVDRMGRLIRTPARQNVLGHHWGVWDSVLVLQRPVTVLLMCGDLSVGRMGSPTSMSARPSVTTPGWYVRELVPVKMRRLTQERCAGQHQDNLVCSHSNIRGGSSPCAPTLRPSTHGAQHRLTRLGTWWEREPSVEPTVDEAVSAPKNWTLCVGGMEKSTPTLARQSALELLSSATAAAPALTPRPVTVLQMCGNLSAGKTGSPTSTSARPSVTRQGCCVRELVPVKMRRLTQGQGQAAPQWRGSTVSFLSSLRRKPM